VIQQKPLHLYQHRFHWSLFMELQKQVIDYMKGYFLFNKANWVKSFIHTFLTYPQNVKRIFYWFRGEMWKTVFQSVQWPLRSCCCSEFKYLCLQLLIPFLLIRCLRRVVRNYVHHDSFIHSGTFGGKIPARNEDSIGNIFISLAS
jgi:hypothetical protein